MTSDEKTIIRHLMRESDMSPGEAVAELADMRARVHDGEDPEELLHEIGLEPDYVFALI